MGIRTLVSLMRVPQWYKSLMVLLALIFSGRLLDPSSMLQASIAFVALSLVSSAGYILNDLVDLRADRAHPEKRKRPVAAGLVSKPVAALVMLLSLVVGFGLGAALPPGFLLAIAGVFGIFVLYSLLLRRVAFADILAISTNFALRAVAGALAISVWVSPWLILCPFFLSLFLSVSKRRATVALLGRKAASFSPALSAYTPETTDALSVVSLTALLLSYALYSFLSGNTVLFVTLPVALYALFRYFWLSRADSAVGREPSLAAWDPGLLLSLALWTGLILLALYLA
ncbi:UbiA family prenyltransferase [Candidatus Woesearchaeota archaeon]|nr:UbiA family prenyltransferase [Candidatus Woesearchaeota archaeon]